MQMEQLMTKPGVWVCIVSRTAIGQSQSRMLMYVKDKFVEKVNCGLHSLSSFHAMISRLLPDSSYEASAISLLPGYSIVEFNIIDL